MERDDALGDACTMLHCCVDERSGCNLQQPSTCLQCNKHGNTVQALVSCKVSAYSDLHLHRLLFQKIVMEPDVAEGARG